MPAPLELTPADVATAAQLACLLEASAPKPGNVSPGRPFHDTRYEDFLASAVAIGPALAEAGRRPLGETIRAAVEATLRWTGANTNLGIVLLLAPLARAALRKGDDAGEQWRGSARERRDRGIGEPGGERASVLRTRLAAVLAETTRADADEVYAAIRLARPGGLGKVEAEDVSQSPTVTLREAMALAADRDSIAREYATDFALTFDVGAPALRCARQAGLAWGEATVEAFLALLASTPDTHIARKLGPAAADAVSHRAAEVVTAGATRTAAGRRALADFDAELRDARNTRNPGTTADLTSSALFVVLLEDGWKP